MVCRKALRSEPRPTFGHYGNDACRVCHRAHYLSQKQKTAGSAVLRFDGYQRIRNEIQALEAQANQTRFRQRIDIRTFAYHV
jgi:hypothetical protein